MDSSEHKDLKQLTTFLPEILDLVNLLTTTSDITAITKSVDTLTSHFKEAQDAISTLSSDSTEQLNIKHEALVLANQEQRDLLTKYRHLPVFSHQQ